MPRAFLLLAALFAIFLVTPASALAHASLRASSPADGETVDSVPTEVGLAFSGTVVAGPGSIQVFDPDGDTVQQGDPKPGKGQKLFQAIKAEEHGTYAIAYRVASEDGHVITGTTKFVVVKASHGAGAAAKASEDAASVDRTTQIAFSITRFVEILSLLVAAGGGIFACLIAPGWRPRLIVLALAALLAAYGFGYVLNAAIAGGTTFTGAFKGSVLQDESDTPFALSLVIRAIVAVVAVAPALLLAYGPPLGRTARAATAVVFVGLAASLSITGHAVTTAPMILRMPLDMVHVVAAAIWLGGLVQLAYMAPFAAANIQAIERFSKTAFASVVVILLTGIYATLVELDLHLNELVDSRYGRLVLAKLVLYLGTMPLAWNNMSAFVPQVRRRPEDAPRMLRQYVWREFALLVVVLGLTVWLIATPQPT